MKTQDAIDLYGSQRALAEKLGCSQVAVSLWGEYPPPARQLQIQKVSRRKLLAEPDCMDRLINPQRAQAL